jgi:GNAT superfamily N-acetyltransferase
MNLDQALLVERHVAEYIRWSAVVPGAELHDDPDVTWIVKPGSVWSNAGIMVRFSAASAARRLDRLVARYREDGRGMGLWISPAATPDNLEELLRARRLNCRKRFPAMVRDLAEPHAMRATPPGLAIRPVEDPSEFERTPHPSIGPITSPRRRHSLDGFAARLLARPARTFAFVAWLAGEPVGASLLFMGAECAGLHDLTVLEEHRGRGYGAALLMQTCQEAVRRGASRMALLATSDGQRVYERCRFVEVARFGYWYRSFRSPS